MVSLAFEVPISLLNTRNSFDFDFVIASHCLHYPEYLKHYEETRGEGRKLFLDNGAFEEGKSIDFEKYVTIIEKLDPDVIVLPDAINDFHATKTATTTFLDNFYGKYSFLSSDVSFMGVLQGKTPEEYLEMLDFYVNNVDALSHVGIPYHLFYRPKFIKDYHIAEICEKLELKIHILGLPNPFEIPDLINIPEISSLDTSLPISSAVNYARFKLYVWKSERINMLTKLDHVQNLIAADNVSFLKYLRNKPNQD